MEFQKLEVENSFINYFNKKTEIYKGMKLIDENLGNNASRSYFKIPKKERDDSIEDDDLKTGVMRMIKIMKNIGLKDKVDLINNVHNYLDDYLR